MKNEKQKVVAIVAGATRGIGKAICEKLAQHNSKPHLIFTYKDAEHLGKEIELELSSQYGIECIGYKCDMTNNEDVMHFFEDAKRNYAQIDILINNVGVQGDSKPLSMINELDWWYVFNSNISPVVYACRQVLPLMCKQQKGRIINITSLSGKKAKPGYSVYSASKAAITAFSKTLVKEAGKLGIIINCVAPALIKTEMLNSIDKELRNKRLQNSILKRMGEVAELVNFLAFSPTYLIGQEIVINGGVGGIKVLENLYKNK